MKKSFYLIPALALTLASCSSDEPLVGGDESGELAVANSFLTVNIRTATGGTRADNTYQEGDGTYEDGTAVENNVSRVRFYFFDVNGNAVNASLNNETGQYNNFIDWYPNSSDFSGADHPATVEKQMSATLGLNLVGDVKPAKVLAVVNPTSTVLGGTHQITAPQEGVAGLNGMNLDEIQDVVTNYLPFQSNNFVMSNSVFVVEDNEGKKSAQYATPINADCFQETQELAAQNAVKVYVERVLARLDLGINMEPADDMSEEAPTDAVYYKVGDFRLEEGDEDNTPDYTTVPIYVKFLGWNTTSTTNESRLLKSINPEWNDATLLGEDEPWSIAAYNRSFWAINPEDVSFQFGNFGNVQTNPEAGQAGVFAPEGQVAMALEIPVNTVPGEVAYTKTYLQENAAPFNDQLEIASSQAPESPSKVILAAQLVDQDGNPITIGEWANNQYTLDGLKNQLARALNTLWYDDDEVPGKKKQISANMLEFTTVDPLGDKVDDQEFYVYAVLNELGQSKTWYNSDAADAQAFASVAAVNQYIRGVVNHAKVWNNGLTYYYFDIRHLAEEQVDAEGAPAEDQLVGYVGVVRNHIYRTTVKSVSGLGTPVFDPDEVIHPTHPDDEESLLAVTIRILSWRVVAQDYDLVW